MFDPPEYVNWKPDPGIIAEFEHTLASDPERATIIAELTEKQLLHMYAGLLRFRLYDITLRRWVKQGILAKAWLGTGEEAVTIGNVHALDRAIPGLECHPIHSRGRACAAFDGKSVRRRSAGGAGAAN